MRANVTTNNLLDLPLVETVSGLTKRPFYAAALAELNCRGAGRIYFSLSADYDCISVHLADFPVTNVDAQPGETLGNFVERVIKCMEDMERRARERNEERKKERDRRAEELKRQTEASKACADAVAEYLRETLTPEEWNQISVYVDTPTHTLIRIDVRVGPDAASLEKLAQFMRELSSEGLLQRPPKGDEK